MINVDGDPSESLLFPSIKSCPQLVLVLLGGEGATEQALYVLSFFQTDKDAEFSVSASF